jgi:hypothetical protein
MALKKLRSYTPIMAKKRKKKRRNPVVLALLSRPKRNAGKHRNRKKEAKEKEI